MMEIQIRKKTDLIEMIVYGCIINKWSNELVKDKAMSILKEKIY